MSQMERSVSVKEVNGIIVAARRYRLKKVACAVVGAVFLCLAGAGGYLIYRKNTLADLKGPKGIYDLHYGICTGDLLGPPHGTIPAGVKDNGSSSSQPSLSAGRLAGTPSLTPTMSTLISPVSNNADTIYFYYSTELITLSVPTNGPLTLQASTASVSTTPTESDTMGSTTQTATTSSETTTTVTSMPSSMGTPSEAILSTQTDKATTKSASSTTQTSTVDKVTSHPKQSTSTGMTSAITLNISTTNNYFDPCPSESPDICTNVTGLIFAFCECDVDGLWTVIQRRYNGSVDFYREWADYKSGFGDVNGEFWLGNDAIHQMTTNANYTLKIILKDRYHVTKHAKYETFKIADEDDGYRLTISGYSGDAFDSMKTDGHMFSTKDMDNDNSGSDCANTNGGAWWYDSCGDANLNGRYHTDEQIRANGINWWEWYRNNRNTGYSLRETKMMLQLNPSH